VIKLHGPPGLISARLALAALAALSPLACDDDPGPFIGDPDYVRDSALDVELVSAHGDTRSHNVGQNCMQCHQSHGPGPGLFTAAGTIYDVDGAPHPDGSLELHGGDGVLVVRIEADSNGNFYTTRALPLPDSPLLPTVLSDDEQRRRSMPWPTNSAACNVCHVGGQVIRLPEE
jgi:hypothetical protein